MVDVAIARWAASGLVSNAALAMLDDVTFGITDLDGLLLGSTNGNRILIDVDAAGFGWFVDATPGDDLEFAADTSAMAGLQRKDAASVAGAVRPASLFVVPWRRRLAGVRHR